MSKERVSLPFPPMLHVIIGTFIQFIPRVAGYIEGGHENSVQVTTQERNFPPGEYIHR